MRDSPRVISVYLTPFENLANAIVKQAVDDYRDALRVLRVRANDREALGRAAEVERFFRSPWYGTLTAVDGELLIRKLREEGE